MNRFTKDVGLIDDYLPACIVDVINLCLVLIGVMSVVIWSNFYVLAPSLLFLVFLVKIHQFYIKTSRDIKRLEAICKS
jgi:ATP-binding cassette subfamily C (CFTR/MRP) protein 4